MPTDWQPHEQLSGGSNPAGDWREPMVDTSNSSTPSEEHVGRNLLSGGLKPEDVEPDPQAIMAERDTLKQRVAELSRDNWNLHEALSVAEAEMQPTEVCPACNGDVPWGKPGVCYLCGNMGVVTKERLLRIDAFRQCEAANKRIAELEAENERLRAALMPLETSSIASAVQEAAAATMQRDQLQAALEAERKRVAELEALLAADEDLLSYGAAETMQARLECGRERDKSDIARRWAAAWKRAASKFRAWQADTSAELEMERRALDVLAEKYATRDPNRIVSMACPTPAPGRYPNCVATALPRKCARCWAEWARERARAETGDAR